MDIPTEGNEFFLEETTFWFSLGNLSSAKSKVLSCFSSFFANGLWFSPSSPFIKCLSKPVYVSRLRDGHKPGPGLAQQIRKHNVLPRRMAKPLLTQLVNTHRSLSQDFLSYPNMPLRLLFLTDSSSCPRKIPYSNSSFNYWISLALRFKVLVKGLGINTCSS